MIYEHGGKATIQIDPTTPLDRLAKSLNVMAHRLVCCYEYRSYSARLRTQLRVAEHNFSARLFSVRLGHELRAERRRKR
jgi:hypothetical protein